MLICTGTTSLLEAYRYSCFYFHTDRELFLVNFSVRDLHAIQLYHFILHMFN